MRSLLHPCAFEESDLGSGVAAPKPKAVLTALALVCFMLSIFNPNLYLYFNARREDDWGLDRLDVAHPSVTAVRALL